MRLYLPSEGRLTNAVLGDGDVVVVDRFAVVQGGRFEAGSRLRVLNGAMVMDSFFATGSRMEWDEEVDILGCYFEPQTLAFPIVSGSWINCYIHGDDSAPAMVLFQPAAAR